MLKYIAIDQRGHVFKIQEHPRKELVEQIGSTHVDKMYCDNEHGEAQHIGYVIGQHWLTIYKVEPWEHANTLK